MDRGGWVIVGLSSSALVLALFLFFGGREAGPRAEPWLQAGDSVSGLQAVDPAGRDVSLATGEQTLLMVFSSDCPHTASVAPLWKTWTAAPGKSFQAIALSAEPIHSAAEYVHDHGWDVEVLGVDPDLQTGLEKALTRRTPWVFLVDGQGVILAEGHGSRIAEIASSPMGAPQAGRRP